MISKRISKIKITLMGIAETLTQAYMALRLMGHSCWSWTNPTGLYYHCGWPFIERNGLYSSPKVVIADAYLVVIVW